MFLESFRLTQAQVAFKPQWVIQVPLIKNLFGYQAKMIFICWVENIYFQAVAS